MLYNCTCCLTCLWNLVTLKKKQTRGISLQLHLAEQHNCYRTKSHKGLHNWSVIVPMRVCLIGSLSKSNPTYWLHHQFNTLGTGYLNCLYAYKRKSASPVLNVLILLSISIYEIFLLIIWLLMITVLHMHLLNSLTSLILN
jgi:hypothetical protein